jgi:hypothetical protein
MNFVFNVLNFIRRVYRRGGWAGGPNNITGTTLRVSAFLSELSTPDIHIPTSNAVTKLPRDICLHLHGQPFHNVSISHYICLWNHPGRKEDSSNAHRVYPGDNYEVHISPHTPSTYIFTSS